MLVHKRKLWSSAMYLYATAGTNQHRTITPRISALRTTPWVAPEDFTAVTGLSKTYSTKRPLILYCTIQLVYSTNSWLGESNPHYCISHTTIRKLSFSCRWWVNLVFMPGPKEDIVTEEYRPKIKRPKCFHKYISSHVIRSFYSWLGESNPHCFIQLSFSWRFGNLLQQFANKTYSYFVKLRR